MATAIGLGFTLSASAQRMASGINAGVVELKKLGYQAKKTSSDVSILKNLAVGKALISSVRATVQQFTSFVSGASHSASAVVDLSESTGVSTQALQGYGLAASESGIGVETLGEKFQKLTMNQGKALNGSTGLQAAFTRLGMSMADLAGSSPEQIFENVVDAISALPTIAQQAASAVALFGRSGNDLLPIFQKGAGYLARMREEAEDLGIVLNQKQISGLDDVDDMIARIALTFGGLRQRIVAEVVPQLMAAGEAMLNFLKTIDVTSAATALAAAIDIAVASFQYLTGVWLPLINTILPPIAAVFQFIGENATGAAVGIGIAAAALAAYEIAAIAASIATHGLTAAVTGLLSPTGIGLLVIAFGLVGGALLQWATSEKGLTAAQRERAAAAKKQASDAAKARGVAIKAIHRREVTKLLNESKIRQQFADVAKDAEALRAKLQNSLQLKSTASLEVSDIRTKEGAAAVFALQAGRVDPAIEAAREQVKKLDEIKRAIVANKPDETVDILGGGD